MAARQAAISAAGSGPGLSASSSGCSQTGVHQQRRGDVRWRRSIVVTAGAARATTLNGSSSTLNWRTVRPGLQRIAPVEPVQVEEWQVGAPPSVYDGPYWRAEWWRGCRSPSARSVAATDEGERFDDFAIRQEWWTGDALPEATVVRRELAGGRRSSGGPVEEKVEELFWETVTQVRAELRAYPGNRFRHLGRKKGRNRHGDSTLPPRSYDAFIDSRALDDRHHVVSPRVALGFRTRIDLAAACDSPCALCPTSNTVCVRPAPAPTPCWRTSWPGRREASIPSWRAGNPESRPHCTARQPRHRASGVCAAPDQPQRPVAGVHRDCCWSYGVASSPPAADATTPGTTGTAALIRTATGPLTGSSPGINPSFSSAPSRACERTAAASGSRQSRRR